MNAADVLRKWKTYAYRLAYSITMEERRAAALAGEALLASARRLADARSEEEGRAVVERAVFREAVSAICACLDDRKTGETR